ncbi:hypothetical protein AB0C87_14870 [Actinomadura sp. NPDC048021]|uniref:hypothetical protein n=1 Tax=Actinomadura sp. NPDC048021 TaxID=3155385 RepID=UPI003407041D
MRPAAFGAQHPDFREKKTEIRSIRSSLIKALGEHPACVVAGLDGVTKAERPLGSLPTTGAALADLRDQPRHRP